MQEKNEVSDEQEIKEPSVGDLVVHTIDKRPMEFSQTVSDLMQQRIADSVYDKKLEIAGSFVREPSQYEVGEEEPAEDENEVEDEVAEEGPEVQEEE